MEGTSGANAADGRQPSQYSTPIPATNDEESKASSRGTHDEEEGESTPLLARRSRVSGLIGMLTGQPTVHKDIDEEHVHQSYNATVLATNRVLFHYTGTVFQRDVLWKETLSTFGIYLLVVLVFSHCRWEGFQSFVGKESTIRAFLSMFSNLIGLLLSFYTSLNIGRWWSMRQAVQQLWSSASKLSMLLAHGVTTDKELLLSIQRYARCSLYLIFAASQNPTDPMDSMVRRGILKEDEAAKLQNFHGRGAFPQASIPWAWLTSAITMLHRQGLTAGPPHLSTLLLTVEQGRASINTVQMYVETPIPMSYLHILGLMVKIHNVFIASLYGLICVMHLGGPDGVNEVAIVRTVFRAFFMPFIYNALLIINGDLTNPFDGDVGDLSFHQFDRCIEFESVTLIEAIDHKPQWMEGRQYASWQK